jgi:hypothetical protein
VAKLQPSRLAFLIRVSRGKLEAESVLFAESIRTWAGPLAGAALYAFTHPNDRPGAETIARLEDLGAEHVDLPASFPHSGDPKPLNKVYVSAWAERELDHDVLVFSDTDTALLAPPLELADDEGWVAAARPVGNSRTAASTGPDDPNDEYWRRMYEVAGVRSEPALTTVVDEVRIRAYWNAGLIAARRSAGLFGAWEETLARLFERGCVYRKPLFMDQLAWAATIADVHERVQVLPPTYNYPLPKRRKLPPEMRKLELEELVHVHYHRWGHLPGFLDEVHPRLDPASERYRWLEERFPLDPTIDEPFRWARRKAPG